MGADYEGQEKGIEILRALPAEAREFLCHHFRNELSVIINGAELGRAELVKAAAWRMVEDLKKIGC